MNSKVIELRKQPQDTSLATNKKNINTQNGTFMKTLRPTSTQHLSSSNKNQSSNRKNGHLSSVTSNFSNIKSNNLTTKIKFTKTICNTSSSSAGKVLSTDKTNLNSKLSQGTMDQFPIEFYIDKNVKNKGKSVERETTPIQEFPAQRHGSHTTENNDSYQYSDRYQSIKSREKSVEREKSPIQEFPAQKHDSNTTENKDCYQYSDRYQGIKSREKLVNFIFKKNNLKFQTASIYFCNNLN